MSGHPRRRPERASLLQTLVSAIGTRSRPLTALPPGAHVTKDSKSASTADSRAERRGSPSTWTPNAPSSDKSVHKRYMNASDRGVHKHGTAASNIHTQTPSSTSTKHLNGTALPVPSAQATSERRSANAILEPPNAASFACLPASSSPTPASSSPNCAFSPATIALSFPSTCSSSPSCSSSSPLPSSFSRLRPPPSLSPYDRATPEVAASANHMPALLRTPTTPAAPSRNTILPVPLPPSLAPPVPPSLPPYARVKTPVAHHATLPALASVASHSLNDAMDATRTSWFDIVVAITRTTWTTPTWPFLCLAPALWMDSRQWTDRVQEWIHGAATFTVSQHQRTKSAIAPAHATPAAAPLDRLVQALMETGPKALAYDTLREAPLRPLRQMTSNRPPHSHSHSHPHPHPQSLSPSSSPRCFQVSPTYPSLRPLLIRAECHGLGVTALIVNIHAALERHFTSRIVAPLQSIDFFELIHCASLRPNNAMLHMMLSCDKGTWFPSDVLDCIRRGTVSAPVLSALNIVATLWQFQQRPLLPQRVRFVVWERLDAVIDYVTQMCAADLRFSRLPELVVHQILRIVRAPHSYTQHIIVLCGSDCYWLRRLRDQLIQTESLPVATSNPKARVGLPRSASDPQPSTRPTNYAWYWPKPDPLHIVEWYNRCASFTSPPPLISYLGRRLPQGLPGDRAKLLLQLWHDSNQSLAVATHQARFWGTKAPTPLLTNSLGDSDSNDDRYNDVYLDLFDLTHLIIAGPPTSRPVFLSSRGKQTPRDRTAQGTPGSRSRNTLPSLQWLQTTSLDLGEVALTCHSMVIGNALNGLGEQRASAVEVLDAQGDLDTLRHASQMLESWANWDRCRTVCWSQTRSVATISYSGIGTADSATTTSMFALDALARSGLPTVHEKSRTRETSTAADTALPLPPAASRRHAHKYSLSFFRADPTGGTLHHARRTIRELNTRFAPSMRPEDFLGLLHYGSHMTDLVALIEGAGELDRNALVERWSECWEPRWHGTSPVSLLKPVDVVARHMPTLTHAREPDSKSSRYGRADAAIVQILYEARARLGRARQPTPQ